MRTLLCKGFLSSQLIHAPIIPSNLDKKNECFKETDDSKLDKNQVWETCHLFYIVIQACEQCLYVIRVGIIDCKPIVG